MTDREKEQLHQDLIQFIEDGDQDSVIELIEDGLSVHENFSEPLRVAIENENSEIVELLVTKYKANVNVMGGAPLRRAVENGNIEIAKILLSNGANPKLKQTVLKKEENKKFRKNNNDKFHFPKAVVPTLALSVAQDDICMTQLLISYGADLTEDDYCILQCVRSSEMLVFIGKKMNMNLLDKKKDRLGLVQGLSEETLSKLDKAIEKIKIIQKVEAL